jgi:hypothetical protein
MKNIANFPCPEIVLHPKARPWLILGFAKSMKRPFTLDDLEAINPVRLGKKRRKEVVKALGTLIDGKLVTRLDNNTYQITYEGFRYFDLTSKFFNSRKSKAASLAKQKRLRP